MLNLITNNNYSNPYSFKQNNYFKNKNQINTVSFKSNHLPNDKKEQFVFVAMPMPDRPFQEKEKWSNVNKLIKNIAVDKNIKAQRIDDILAENPEKLEIRHSILEGIKNSKAVIADLSEPNPNVYFEMGYALGCGKKVYPIAKNGTVLPFDVEHINTTFYKNRKSDLANKLDKLLTKISRLNVEQK